MNDVFENIYLRRSVRNYKPNDVPDDIIREVIRAGTYAPFVHDPTVEVGSHQDPDKVASKAR